MAHNWDEVYALFEQETESLSGGGVIVHTDGSIEPHPDHYHAELEPAELVEEPNGTWSYAGNPLYEESFDYQGRRYFPMHSSEVPTPGFLRHHAEPVLDRGKDVFLGAEAIIPEDGEGIWFFIVEELD